MKRLKDVSSEIAYFIETARTLGDQLGPVLFQLHPTMKQDLPRLQDFLAIVPEGVQAVLEFRHESWFAEPVYETLRAHNAALCIADTEEGCSPLVATASHGYLRLRRPDYDVDALRLWRDRVQQQAWDQAFVFFKHEDEARGPYFARQFLDLLE